MVATPRTLAMVGIAALLVAWPIPKVASDPLETGCSLTFDASSEGFTKFSEQTHSEVSWDEPNGRVRAHVDRQDPQPELWQSGMANPLTPDASFAVTAHWRATTQGNWQNAAALLLAGDGVTSDPTTPLYAQANAFEILYLSRDSNLAQNPSYFIKYTDDGGVPRIDHEFVGTADTEYHFSLDYDAATNALTGRIRDANDVELAAASYVIGAVPGDGFQFEKLVVASERASEHSGEPPIEAWVDNVGQSFLNDATPCQPIHLTAVTAAGVGAIDVSWQAPSSVGDGPITGYRVYRSTAAAGPFDLIANLAVLTTMTDQGLPDAALRYYRVSALNAFGEGPLSSTAKGTTLALPGPPTDLTATMGPGTGEITLGWKAPTTEGVGPNVAYRIHRSPTMGGPYEQVAEVQNALVFTDAGLPDGSNWFYRASAANLVGEGPLSNEAIGTTYLACFVVVCVGTPLTTLIGDLAVPEPNATMTPAVVITAELGTLTVQVAGTFSEQAIALARAKGEPNPAILNQNLGIASTRYTKVTDVCVAGSCSFVISTPTVESEKVGELWNARLQVFVAGFKVTDQPFLALEPTL